MGHPWRLALQGSFYNPVLLGLIETRFASPARRYLPYLANPSLMHSLAPQLHGRPAHFKLLGNRHIVLTRQRCQYNPAAQRYLLRSTVRGFPLLQLR